ncbi:hypothetical protein PRIPAC_82440 [Pristionchus pacificus]|uniref:Post-SET domain-containing protein n=1 Tax=Pristionchus pacificus TaxID=54126 RepID=A0A2A6CPJ1_PRIPA|nr:hypothetical protein PRIPAC_82440 [Pristionchus pacificus]|eukprot:PDM80040.1 hypothetical protein PRIPAC_32619 [Pristionchus pacificus]
MAVHVWIFGMFCLQVVSALPYYIATKSFESLIRRHGPIRVSKQYECALACSCANDRTEECSVFNPPIPNVNCLAYSYDFTSRQCALLGGPSPNMCSKPVTIYELGDVTANPKCGPTTIDEMVICDSEGYKCPSRYLPYLAREFSNSKQYFFGGKFTCFNGSSWILSSVYGLTDDPRAVVQNITCHPAYSHTNSVCDNTDNAPYLKDSLMVKDTFECFPGFEWDYGYTTETVKIRSVPLCTEHGWSERGVLLTALIRTIACGCISPRDDVWKLAVTPFCERNSENATLCVCNSDLCNTVDMYSKTEGMAATLKVVECTNIATADPFPRPPCQSSFCAYTETRDYNEFFDIKRPFYSSNTRECGGNYGTSFSVGLIVSSPPMNSCFNVRWNPYNSVITCNCNTPNCNALAMPMYNLTKRGKRACYLKAVGFETMTCWGDFCYWAKFDDWGFGQEDVRGCVDVAGADANFQLRLGESTYDSTFFTICEGDYCNSNCGESIQYCTGGYCYVLNSNSDQQFRRFAKDVWKGAVLPLCERNPQNATICLCNGRDLCNTPEMFGKSKDSAVMPKVFDCVQNATDDPVPSLPCQSNICAYSERRMYNEFFELKRSVFSRTVQECVSFYGTTYSIARIHLRSDPYTSYIQCFCGTPNCNAIMRTYNMTKRGKRICYLKTPGFETLTCWGEYCSWSTSKEFGDTRGCVDAAGADPNFRLHLGESTYDNTYLTICEGDYCNGDTILPNGTIIGPSAFRKYANLATLPSVSPVVGILMLLLKTMNPPRFLFIFCCVTCVLTLDCNCKKCAAGFCTGDFCYSHTNTWNDDIVTGCLTPRDENLWRDEGLPLCKINKMNASLCLCNTDLCNAEETFSHIRSSTSHAEKVLIECVKRRSVNKHQVGRMSDFRNWNLSSASQLTAQSFNAFRDLEKPPYFEVKQDCAFQETEWYDMDITATTPQMNSCLHIIWNQKSSEVRCICNTTRCNEKIPMYELPKRGKGVCYLKSKETETSTCWGDYCFWSDEDGRGCIDASGDDNFKLRLGESTYDGSYFVICRGNYCNSCPKGEFTLSSAKFTIIVYDVYESLMFETVALPEAVAGYCKAARFWQPLCR